MSEKIHPAMLSVLKNVGAISKDDWCKDRNGRRQFQYRSIDAVYNRLHQLFGEFGIYVSSEVLDIQRSTYRTTSGAVMHNTLVKVRYRFIAEDGSSVTTESIGEGSDSGDKSASKALAIASKYALTQVFVVPYAGMVDPDSEQQDPPERCISDKELNALREDMQTYGLSETRVVDFLKRKLGIQELAMLPVSYLSKLAETLPLLAEKQAA